jgi:serine/threonine-protein kinase RsbW
MESARLNAAPTAGLAPSDGNHRHSRSPTTAAGVRLQMTWRLPRNADSIPTVRHLLDTSLALLCVEDGCRYEIAVMLSEACANAVLHADGREYVVHVDLDHERCVIEVVDTGPGLDPAMLRSARFPPGLVSQGRGLALLDVYSDQLELHPAQPRGLSVKITKNLNQRPD